MAGEAKTKTIEHIKKRIEMRNLTPKFRQSIGGIKSARQEGEGRDYIAGHRRHVIKTFGNYSA